MDPVYPVYVDTNVMAGHTGPADEDGIYSGLVYLPCTPENGFMPDVPDKKVDLIYLCSPNNPTGAVARRDRLEDWVRFALEHEAVILYDAAYEAYIAEAGIPHSIYEIADARQCAIEFRSFSKNGGFTGVRCAFTVVPKDLECQTARVKNAPSTRFGTVASAQSSTASRLSLSARQRLCIPMKENLKSRPWFPTTWETPGFFERR